jgi:putative ABC transport system permease protein
MVGIAVSIGLLLFLACLALGVFAITLFLIEAILGRWDLFPGSSLLLLLVRSLRRNRTRTALTFTATFVLVFVVSAIGSVLYYLDQFLSDQGRAPRVVVSEKWQVLSQMPLSYARPLSEGAARKPGDVRPTDTMTWQLYLGTTDPEKPSPENIVVGVAMDPAKVLTMFVDLFEELATDSGGERSDRRAQHKQMLEDAVRAMKANKTGIILGQTRLASLNKRVGDKIKLIGMQYRDINLEFEILGVLPPGRYGDLGVINHEYFNAALDDYARKHGGPHPMASKTLTRVWLQMADQNACARVAEQIDSSGLFQAPPVRCQTLSAEVASVLEGFSVIIWGLRWLLFPAVLGIMTLVMVNAIGISVRERSTEMALLKVVGFRPWQILILVLGEALLVGTLAGLLSALLSRIVVNDVLNRLSDNPIDIPVQMLWWCPAVGLLTALVGSLAPAWTACRIKPAQVFSRSA